MKTHHLWPSEISNTLKNGKSDMDPDDDKITSDNEEEIGTEVYNRVGTLHQMETDESEYENKNNDEDTRRDNESDSGIDLDDSDNEYNEDISDDNSQDSENDTT